MVKFDQIARRGPGTGAADGLDGVWWPDRETIRATVRLLPDSLRLLRRLTADRAIPLRTRILVWVLIAYLASPIDLVPDFVPVLGYADDVIIASIVLRHVVRRAGAAKLREHWPGSPDGLAQLQRLLRISAAQQ